MVERGLRVVVLGVGLAWTLAGIRVRQHGMTGTGLLAP